MFKTKRNRNHSSWLCLAIPHRLPHSPIPFLHETGNLSSNHHASISGSGKPPPSGSESRNSRCGHSVARGCSGSEATHTRKTKTKKFAPERTEHPTGGRGPRARLQAPPAGAASPTSPGARQPGQPSPGAYLKHVVSSPEGFRHGYLVVAMLFSEQISLKKLEELGWPLRARVAGNARRSSAFRAPRRRRSPSADAGRTPRSGPGEGPTQRTGPQEKEEVQKRDTHGGRRAARGVTEPRAPDAGARGVRAERRLPRSLRSSFLNPGWVSAGANRERAGHRRDGMGRGYRLRPRAGSARSRDPQREPVAVARLLAVAPRVS